MPTRDRRSFVGSAVAAFLAQTEADSELLILDGGEDMVDDLVSAGSRVRYWRDEQVGRTIGSARNFLCAHAAGDVIVHWDDDDWHAPHRVAAQAAALARAGADICGLKVVPFLNGDGSAAWDYVWEHPRPWVYGASFAYRRDHWAQHPFPDRQIGEDNVFVLANPGRVLAVPDADWLVCCVHPGNTAVKDTAGPHYVARDPAPLRERIAGWGTPSPPGA